MAFKPLGFLAGRRAQQIPETGEFPCPHCGVDRTYSLLVAHETYGILDRYLPGLSGKIVEMRVTCQTCQAQFPADIRDRTLYRDRKAAQDLVQRLRDGLGEGRGTQ